MEQKPHNLQESGRGGSKETDAQDGARGASPPSDTGSESVVRVHAPASASSQHSELRERVALCKEQIAESPYSHTIAAGWYAEDVEGLLEQLEAAQEALREIAAYRVRPVDHPTLAYAEVVEIARSALEPSPASRSDDA